TLSKENISICESDMVGISYGNNEDWVIDIAGTYHLLPREFERTVAKVFERRGYCVDVVARPGDHGCDVVVRGDRNILVQVKQCQSPKKIGTKKINEIRGAKSTYEMQYGTQFDLCVVTNGGFSLRAKAHATNGDFV